jgi:hypothetical protein
MYLALMPLKLGNFLFDTKRIEAPFHSWTLLLLESNTATAARLFLSRPNISSISCDQKKDTEIDSNHHQYQESSSPSSCSR